MQNKVDWKKYIIVLVITILLFLIAGALSGFFTDKKLQSIRTVQDKIATDILSSETQYSLLSELSCEDIGQGNLSDELNSIADKIAYSEQNLKYSDEVIELKKYYTLLEIKDYLLSKKIGERCGKRTPTVFYFYTTAENCTLCTKQGYVLTELRSKYPDLRVYSFDYNLDLSASNALLRIYDIKDTELPTLVINDKTKVTGFKSVADIEKLIPTLVKMKKDAEATSATSTKK
ncbi:MAG: thioredoxin family protein [bacterium]